MGFTAVYTAYKRTSFRRGGLSVLKTLLKRAAIGFLIGIIMGNGIVVMINAFSGDNITPVTKQLVRQCGGNGSAFILQTILSGFYGAACFAGCSLYDIESLPLTLTSVIHCFLIVTLYIPVSFFLGWSCTVWEVLIMAGAQTAVYFIIWLILYFSYRRQANELNKLQSTNRTL